MGKWCSKAVGNRSSFNNCYLEFVGVLKAVQCAEPYTWNRVTKDVVAFQAGDFHELVEKLQLDLHEPPISQVGFFFM